MRQQKEGVDGEARRGSWKTRQLLAFSIFARVTKILLRNIK